MTDKKDEPIIELTEVVEEAPEPSGGSWMENASSPVPPPSPQEKAPESPPVLPRKEAPRMDEALKGIPDSPLKKFILAEEEPTSKLPSPPAKAPEFPPVSPQPPRIFPEPAKPAPAPRFTFPEAPRPVPEPPPMPPEPVRSAPEPPPKPPVLNVEAELRIIREAMLSRVERWVSQEGVQVLERVAREIFPKISEEILRKEIEKIKAEAEEKE
jgi:hypothetical protein